MKMNKFAAALVGTAVAASAVSVTAFADDSYTATLGFTDTNWTFQDWESSVEITGDGTYTITSTAVAGTEEIGVFVIDCQGMFAANPDAVATLDSIEIDGSAISFDASKIMYGDIEEKGNFRIDIYNMYSETKDDPAFTNATPIAESLSVTFTVTGLGGAAEEAAEESTEEAAEEEAPAEDAAEEAPASDDVTAPAATGNASAAAIAAVAAVAGTVAVISKRK
ncbi:MAG: hypothetical protein SOU50_00645 [Oscillospiraceae bacterium]|nr:hypothetical protein [Oscillospiraceae bacterium]MDY2846713.1 hypothetical protein [Oscillospiraceae bacterium]